MPQSQQSFYPEKTRDAIIPNGGSLSNQFSVGSGTLVAVVMPAAWTAAVLTFQGSTDGVNFNDLYDFTGTEVSVTVAAGEKVLIDHMDGNAYLKIRSGTGGTPVAQGAARNLIAIVKKPTTGFGVS